MAFQKILVGLLCLCSSLFIAGVARSGTENQLLDEAYWIWHTKDVPIKKHHAHFFSKQLRLDAPIKSASVQITAEGPCTVTVNGALVGVDDRWYNLARYDLKPFLKTGENQLLVRVSPNNWYAGLFVAGRIEMENQDPVAVLSDDSWQVWTHDEPAARKAEKLVKGVDGGFWCSVTPMEMPKLHNELNLDLVAPHIAWARPFAGNPPKVLAIFPRKVQRDMVELIHRFDMDVTAVFSDYYREDRRAPFFRAVNGALKKDVIANIRKALKDEYDVVILGDIPPEVFHDVIGDRFLQMVKSGTGLIYSKLPKISFEEGEGSKFADLHEILSKHPIQKRPRSLTTGVPFDSLPGFGFKQGERDKAFSKAVSLYTFEKGRVARIHRPGRDMLVTISDGKDDLRYEYYQSFMIKLILWAAQKESGVHFKDFPEKMLWDRHANSDCEVKFDLEDGTGNGEYEATLSVRSPNPLLKIPTTPMVKSGLHITETLLSPVYQDTKDVTIGKDIRFSLPALPAGEYFVDVEVLKKGRKVNWATAHLTVTSKLGIAALDLSPSHIDFAQEQAPRLKVAASFSDALPEKGTMTFCVLDNYDRLVLNEQLKVSKNQAGAEIVFDVPFIPTTLAKVRAELKIHGKSVDIVVGRLTTIRQDWDRFAFVGWAHAGSNSRQQRVLARVLAGLGFDAQRGKSGSFDRLEVADIQAFPGAGGKRRGPIDTSPAVLEKEKKEAIDLASKNLPFDPFGYVTSDEVSYGGGDDLPSRVNGFRRSLNEQYGSIEALNKQWDTGYRTFEEIPAITKNAAKEFEIKAKTTLNFSPLVDRYLENCRVYAERFGFYQKAINSIDPHARFGIESPLWPWASRCFDWYAILQNIRLFSPYGLDGDIQTTEYARSFARPGTVLGMTYGGYTYDGFVRRQETTDLEFQRWRPWNALLRGFNCVYWYTLGATVESGVGMGMQPYPALLVASEQIDQIRSGFYTLFRGTKKVYDPVAIHYSVPSNIMADYIKDFGKLPWTVHMLIRILQDYAPLSYKFVSTQQIENGKLNNYKVLFMPLSQAVGIKEAEAIKRFVENGGLVIADVRPGVFDQHGKFGANRVMQDLFGIKYKKALGREKVPMAVIGNYMGIPFNNKRIDIPVDPSVTLNGAQAALDAGGIPLVVSNKVGKGTAVCLNIPFNSYQYYPTPDTLYYYLADPEHATVIGNILKSVFKAHQIDRVLKVDFPDDKWPWGLETWYAVDGQAQYVGVTKRRAAKREPDSPITVRAPRTGHVYDMFTGRYLGKKIQWQMTVAPADVQLFSILPYQVESLMVECPLKTVEPGNVVNGEVWVVIGDDRETRVRHVIHLEVIRPDGKAVRYLAQNLETRNGSADFSIPLALNEPSGEYSLIFTDVATRSKKTAQISLNYPSQR
jgi:hypothetical protein